MKLFDIFPINKIVRHRYKFKINNFHRYFIDVKIIARVFIISNGTHRKKSEEINSKYKCLLKKKIRLARAGRVVIVAV